MSTGCRNSLDADPLSPDADSPPENRITGVKTLPPTSFAGGKNEKATSKVTLQATNYTLKSKSNFSN